MIDRPIGALGLGNVLMGDDALGPYVIEWLRANYRFPSEVELEDLGTPGLDLHPFLAEREGVILVDTVRSDAPAGTIRVYEMADVLQHVPKARVGPHDPGVKEALLSLQFQNRGPHWLRLVGVVPESVENRVGLSRSVRGAVPHAAVRVVCELLDRGYELSAKFPRGKIEPWWERATGSTELEASV